MATDYTPTTWAAALLARLGVPVTSSNVSAITAWENAEGGNWHNPDRFNPLNTTQSEPGSVATNAAGVRSYTSWDQGLTATVSTLTNGLYGGILAALGRGSSADEVISAVVKSPWGTKRIGSASGGDAAAAADQTGSPSVIPDLFTPLSRVMLTISFVGGGALLVVLGLMRGTTPGQKYADHLKKGAEMAAVVA